MKDEIREVIETRCILTVVFHVVNRFCGSFAAAAAYINHIGSLDIKLSDI